MRDRHVQNPHTPVGLRPETMAEFERLLYITPKYDPYSPAEYTIKYDNNGRTLFTVTGQKYTNRRVREFRDASGLPLFECQRSWPAWGWRRPWRVRLPGTEGEDLVNVKSSRSATSFNFDLEFRNAMAKDAKNEADKLVTVEVRRVSSAFCKFSGWVGGRKVLDFRESMERNRTIYSAASGFNAWRSIVEVYVADGFDFALASLISIMICDSFFNSTSPDAETIAAREKRLNPVMG